MQTSLKSIFFSAQQTTVPDKSVLPVSYSWSVHSIEEDEIRMSTRKYTQEHEWIEIDGDVGSVGISDYAQEQLGNIVFVDLPEIGRKLTKGEEAAVIESVKAASELYAPVSGEVTEINEKLDVEPDLINSAPTGEGWFIKIRVSDRGQFDNLMDEAGYMKFIETLD
jgi:glycine cleavage system H protein